MSTSPARMRRHSSERSPSPRPEWTQRDPRVEVGPQPVDEREGEGDLRHEHERRPSGLERRGDRLDVDRGLATAGHAVEQERARVAGGDRGHDPGDRLGLGGQEVARGGPAAAPAGRSCRERPARAFADLGLGQTAPDEPGRAPSVRGGRPGRPRAVRRLGAAASSARRSTWRGPSGRPGDRLPGRQRGSRRPSRVEEPDPALVAWPGARRPAASIRGSPGPPPRAPRRRRRSPARPSGPARSRTGRGPRASWSSRSVVARAAASARAPPPSRGCPSPGLRPVRGQLGDQLEPFEQARRQHRPQDERRRRQVVPRDRRRQRESQRAAAAARRRGPDRRSAWRRPRAARSPRRRRSRAPAAGRTRPGPPRRARGPRARPARGTCTSGRRRDPPRRPRPRRRASRRPSPRVRAATPPPARRRQQGQGDRE